MEHKIVIDLIRRPKTAEMHVRLLVLEMIKYILFNGMTFILWLVVTSFGSVFSLQEAQHYFQIKKEEGWNSAAQLSNITCGRSWQSWLPLNNTWHWRQWETIVVDSFDMALVNSWLKFKLLTVKKNKLNLFDFRKEISCFLKLLLLRI